MDATQAISDAILESEEEENEENENRRGSPLAKLCILKNPHVPEAELPLFLGDNVLGRDPSLCTLPMAASSVSKQHATICISVYRRRGARCDVDMEALVWDLGSMNGTRKGRLKLTPNVRYALSEGDSLVLADIPCQYVRWGGVSSQDDMKIPGCVLSGVKGTFPDAPGGKQGDTDRGSKRGVNSGAKATKTPVRGSFLSFEQTPTQPKGCLVPDSDSDSDGERDGGGIGHQKTRVSDSDSHISSPNSSAFLSPSNKIVPESEDESPVTLSFSSQPSRHVSFNTEKSDVCVERNRSPNDETDGKGGTASKDSGQNQNGESNVTFREDESLVSTPEVSREAIPDFNMDSDTDVEAEEEGVPAEPLSFNTSQRADQRSDEPSEAHSDETTKPAHVASGIQPEDIIIDSDTDDDDDDVSDAVIKASSFQDAHTADAASSVQLKDFHLDSDTDVEEEIKSNLNPAAAAGDPSVAAATAESSSPAAAGPDLDILSDSDTDMEEDCLLVKPLVTADPSEVSGKAPGALESDSDEDTDVDEPCVTHAGDSPAELRVDGDASAEDQEEDAEEAGEDHIPHLPLVPTLQNYSTPVQVSGEVEDLETQAFTSTPSGLFRCPALNPAVPLSSDSPEDEDYAEAETQPFVLQTRDRQTAADPKPSSAPEPKADDPRGSFQLGLSDSRHRALATENTQAYVSADGRVNLEETQAYEATSNLDATQAYEEEEEPVRDSEESETKVCVNLALEATQAYVSDSCDDSDEDKRQDAAPTETTELTDHSSALATAETQPVPSFEEESLEIRNPVCSVQSVETKERDPAQPREKHLFEAETQPMCMTDTEEGDDEDSTAPLQLQEDPTEPQTCSPSALAETQPMHVDEGENDDDSVPLKAKRLSVEEEESQRLGGSDAYVAETQPVFVSEDDDEGDWGPRRREAKPPQLEEEQTRPQISSDVSSRPEDPGEENDSEILVVPRKRKAKQLHIEDESQQLLSSAETQPTRGEDVEAGPQGGEAMPLQRDEGQINPSTEVAGVDKHDHKDAVTAKQHDLKETTVSAEADPPSVSNSRQTRARLRGKEDADGSASTKRRTRQESKTLPSTRGSRGKAVTQSEEDVKQCKQARGRKNTRRQEDEEDDNKIIAAKEAIKGQKEGNLEQDEKESERMHASVTKEKQEWVEQERRNQGELKNKEKASAERLQGGELEESEGKRDEEEKLNVSARPRRSARKTAPCAAGPEQPSTISTREDFAARRTRSHSNSSNSVSSERSASSVSAQESRGRGRGEKRSSEALQTPVTRSSRRRTTATVAPIEKGREAVRSEISTCSESPQNRARGCRQRGKGRKTVSDLQNSTERVGKTGRAEELSSEVLPMGDEDKGDAQQPATSRGQQRVGTNAKHQSHQEEESVEEKSPLPKRRTGGRGHVEEPVALSVSEEGRNKRKGRKSELEVNIKADGASVFKGKALKATEREEGKDERIEESSSTVQVRRTSRASSAQVKKNAKEPPPGEPVEDGETMEVQAAERRTRVRTANKEEVKEGGTSASSMKQEAPATPDSRVSRKRRASSDSSPLAKTPRSSSGSPAAIGRLRAGSQSYKVLFTGVVDEGGERELARLGGGMAKGVADMNCLVTDKVRRTVKFLCAVAKGVPVVTTDWLEKSGKAGSFLPTDVFVVKDPEQEKKFSFCLQESLRTARSRRLLQGYEIHVTKSVKPEPVHMKDILSCSGATFLSKMPSSHKPQTVVISCEEDWRLCGPAVSASLPVVSTEFILTGILQQKLDFHTHALSPSSAANSQPAGDRGRTRRKT
uniref:Mediator of DNA damage checkpoint protein 1 n=1 Tax=Nothobranchius furzeri TaxID=105023 RepID=A0A1A8UB51_NOTFU